MNWNYISGFFDADGSICFTKVRSSGMKTIQVSFHNNDRALLKSIRTFISSELGIVGIMSVKPAKKATHQTAYELKYVQQHAYKVCTKLTCVQAYKRHKVAVTVLYYNEVTPRNGKYNDRLLSFRKAFERLFYWSSVS